jgi:hypothetical protein
MAKCANCGNSIWFGGVNAEGRSFCNRTCQRNAYLAFSAQVPAEQIDTLVRQVHGGACPKCKGRGPVSLHRHHQVWSAIFMTRWVTMTQISCRRCARKAQALSALQSGLLGWWGFPWGLIMTPIQLGKNIYAMLARQDDSKPSRELETAIRLNVASQLLRSQRSA